MLQFFFYTHTKLLFLIDNQQPKVFEFDILAYNAVSSDQNINLPSASRCMVSLICLADLKRFT